MCLYCHLSESPESSVKTLKDALENPRFEEWNTTNFSHALLAVKGLDGEEAHKLSCILVEQFYDWFLGWSNGYWEWFGTYFPKNGLEPFPSVGKIREMIDEAWKFYQEHGEKTRDEMIKQITGGKSEEDIRNRKDD